MSQNNQLTPVFVEFIPTELEPGNLYISMEYTTTVHLCASGCGNKVVLPLSPAQWHLTYDGEAVSLSPSVGNWDLPCHSHYWIRKNTIEWAPKWDKKRIAEGRQQDARDIDSHIKSRSPTPATPVETPKRVSWWQRLFGR